jgi:thymidylate synthase (FAD)
MKIVKPSYKIKKLSNGRRVLRELEEAARTCYKSEDRITDVSAKGFLRKLLSHDPAHLSIIEHESMKVKFICNRGFSHELVRHRPVSYSQESTRYCNYSKGKFGSVISVIKPLYRKPGTVNYKIWKETIETIERTYMKLLELGEKPEEARDILPMGTYLFSANKQSCSPTNERANDSFA